ncbi:MAG: hypothetical protein ACTSYU_07980 [Promethearchaeota archaeon]
MKIELSLQTRILRIYRIFTSFYHKMLLNPSEITLEEIIEIQTDFNGFFSKIALREYKNSTNSKIKQLVLKYLCQYSTLFCFSPQMLLKIIQKRLSWYDKGYLFFIRFRNHKIFHKKVREMGYDSVFGAYIDIFDIDWPQLKQEMTKFMKSTEDEYLSLLFAFKSNFNHDHLPLNREEKRKLYEGTGLPKKFLQFPYEKIIQNVQKFFQENQFLTNEMVNRINIEIRSTSKHMNVYESITLPNFSTKEKKFTKVKVVLKKSSKYSISLKNIPHELGHCVQFCNLVSTDINNNIQKIIPYESAISELGGEIFESLFCFPEYIAKIFEINSKTHANEISNYFRLIDLLYKRNYTIYFITQAVFLSSSSRNLFSRNKTQKNFKKLAKKNLHLREVSFSFNYPNIIHHLDFIRGLLFIQEPFLQQCHFSLDSFLSHRDSLLRFFSEGISQPYEGAHRYFSSTFHQNSTYPTLEEIKLMETPLN